MTKPRLCHRLECGFRKPHAPHDEDVPTADRAKQCWQTAPDATAEYYLCRRDKGHKGVCSIYGEPKSVDVETAPPALPLQRVREPWSAQQERLLAAAQALVNTAAEHAENRDGEQVIVVFDDDYAELKAVVQEISDDVVALIKSESASKPAVDEAGIIMVGPGEGDFYWINKAGGNYRCNVCGFQYHDGQPLKHFASAHQRAPLTVGTRRTER